MARPKERHVKPLVEAVVSVVSEANSRMNMVSGITTRTNLMEGMIVETIIILEAVFKRG